MATKPRHKFAGITIDDLTSKIKDADLNAYFIFGAIILVLAVGIYAIFSPDAQNMRLGNPACGKIVIAADGKNLTANVSPSLNEALYFHVVNPLSGKLIESIRNPYRGPQINPQTAYLIAGKGEEAVIVGSIDQQSYAILMQFGIRVFGGYQGKARSAVRLYKQARISQSPLSSDVMPQTPMAASAPVASQQAGQVGFGPGRGQCYFVCPRCRATSNQQGLGGMCPMCPNCQMQMVQGNQQVMQGGQMMQGNMMQGNMAQAGIGVPDVNNLGINDIGNMGNQAVFGLGEQAFLCPNCRWRLKCVRQGNSFPRCPNCKAPMALDVKETNKIWNWFSDGQWAANNGAQQSVPQVNQQNQMMAQQNQMMTQPSFWQGPQSTEYFICPSCNWRMYAQRDPNDAFPQCPNCKNIMARGGVYNTNQNMQNNGMGPQAAYQAQPQQNQVQTPAPVIFRDAAMPHAYRGVCENCHVIRADIPIQSNAQMPHTYRGVCSNCHQILGAQAGANNGNNNGSNNQSAQDPNGQTVAFGNGGCVIR